MNARDIEPGIVGGQPPTGFQLDVRADGFPLTEALRQYIADHLAAKLAKHARQIQSVVIRVLDVNGTKGGEDKTCEVEVYLRGRKPVVVSQTDHDLRAAIGGVADRVQNALTRELGRGRERPQQRGRKIVRARKTLQ
jgi:putative sigma-54 modulation protein